MNDKNLLKDLNNNNLERKNIVFKQYGLENQYYCTCGYKFSSLNSKDICPNCKTEYSPYTHDLGTLKGSKKKIFGIHFVLEYINDHCFQLTRYNEYILFSQEKDKIEREIAKSEYITYDLYKKNNVLFVLNSKGKYIKTKDIGKIVRTPTSNLITMYFYDIKDILKCSLIFKRTGLIEYLVNIKRIDIQSLTKNYKNLSEDSKSSFLSSILEYLNFYKNSKEIEFLLKDDYKLSKEMIKKCIQNHYDITHYFNRSTNLYGMFSLNKSMVKLLKDDSLDIVYCLDRIDKLQKVSTKNYLEFKNMNLLEDSYNLVLIKEILELKFGISNKKIIEYLKRLNNYQAIQYEEGVSLWRDYLYIISNLKLCKDLKYNKYPNSLKKEHDLLNREAKFIKDKILNNKYNEVKDELKKYEYSNSTYSIIIPNKLSDLIEEGKVLNHCVAIYMKLVANQKTTILFVRRKRNTDKPFFTLEIRNNAIRQLQGFNNTTEYSDTLKTFIDQYKRKVLNKLNKKNN